VRAAAGENPPDSNRSPASAAPRRPAQRDQRLTASRPTVETRRAQRPRRAFWRGWLAAAARTVDSLRPRVARRGARAAALLVLVLGVGTGIALAFGAQSTPSPVTPADAPSPNTPSVTGLSQLPQPWLGLTTTSSTNLGGALVTQVVPGGPADQAGLQQGDVITAIDGQSISGPGDIAGIIDSQQVGAEVLLQIDRGGQLQTVGVILASRPSGGP
jgi:PDZ domain